MKRFLRALARPVKGLLARYGYGLHRLDTPNYIEPLLYRCLRACPDFFFVEIGANDGIASDALYPFVTRHRGQVSGLVVEPMKDVFEELKRNYAAHPKIVPVNVAIHNSATEMNLYRVDPAKQGRMADWTKGIASFNPHHHALSGTAGENIVVEKVPCVTLPGLLKTHGVKKVDLLQMDTEGYDYEILTGIDFTSFRPSLVRFEHGLPSGIMTKEKLKRLLDMFYENDYFIILESYDAIAYRRDL